MIVLGISPGVRSLAYCLVATRENGALEVVDHELMKGGRPQPSDTKEALQKRSRPHSLVLHIVMERAFEKNGGHPLIVAIGPSGKDLPSIELLAVRVVLLGLCAELEGLGVRLTTLNIMRPNELAAALGAPVKTAVRQELGSQGAAFARAPYLLMAAGTALAALRQTQGNQRVGEVARST